MLINTYITDKNTSKNLKVSGTHKLDSWIKHYTLTIYVELRGEQEWPDISEFPITGKFRYVLNEIDYYAEIEITERPTTDSISFDIYSGTVKPSYIGISYIELQYDISYNFEEFLNVCSYSDKLSTSIQHISGTETSIDFVFNSATVNKYYEITYTITNNSIDGFSSYLMVGSNKGAVITEEGSYVEHLKMLNNKTISFFVSGDITISNFNIKEYVVLSDPLDFSDKDGFENYSWTLSYSLDFNKWVSFHSYIPDFYLTTNNYMYSLVNDELSVEYTIRDDMNNFITGSDNEIIVYKYYTYND